MRHPLALGVAATAAVVLLAGCGSSSSTSSTSSAASAPSTAAQSTPAPTTTAASAASGELMVTKHGKLGTILAAGPKKMTVYLWEGDKGAASSCTGACAKAWPPVTTNGAPTAAGSAVTADPISSETVEPTATRSAPTPTNRANTARAPSVLWPHCSQLVRPLCQSASADCSASQAGFGGSP